MSCRLPERQTRATMPKAWNVRIVNATVLAVLGLGSSAVASEEQRSIEFQQKGYIRVCADRANLPFSGKRVAVDAGRPAELLPPGARA